ncbi:hypothetical protein [Methanooceanicella nereidis]|nr:hypothetical protein [Methanocella sp. CWC-04]
MQEFVDRPMGVDHQSSDDRSKEAEDLFDAEFKRTVAENGFLDAVCNGLLVIGKDFIITSQNYVARAKMGDLTGKCCYEALERSSSPCDFCPMVCPPQGDFEVSMRNTLPCADRWYKVMVHPIMDDDNNIIGVTEIYPDMIDRQTVMQDLCGFEEELQLLNSAVDDICNITKPNDVVTGPFDSFSQP